MGGIPRYLHRRAARAALGVVRAVASRGADPAGRLSSELRLWEFAGTVYGRSARVRGVAGGRPTLAAGRAA
jgi:hypothetical protein